MSTDRTTRTLDREPHALERSYPALFLAMECNRPLAGPARIALGSVQSVDIGRGERRRIEADGTGRLTLRIPDPTMSAVHASLHRVGGGWELRDIGSKNGTVVNGAPRTVHMLADGDMIEAGETLFLFRRAVPDAIDSLDAAALAAQPRGMATLIPALAREFERVSSVATGSIAVCIVGETGTGKELLASAVHALSTRSGPFVAVNCAAIPPGLFASELFGHRRGAFSGANEDRTGLVRAAEGGTLFLDEIGEIAPEAQLALLRILQEREVLPLGATRPLRIDVRFVSATSRDLATLVENGCFRADLYARLAGFVCRLPPLVQRREDLGLMVADALAQHGRHDAKLTVDAARALWRYSWPGNVRELHQSIHAALLLAHDNRISASHLPAEVRAAGEGDRLDREALPLCEEDVRRRQQIVDLLRSHAGNVSAVARAMSKERRQVHRWLERYGIDASSFRH